MKRKFVKALLISMIAIMPGSIVVHAEDAQVQAQSQNGILFREIPWYSTKADVEAKLFAEGASNGGRLGETNQIYRMSGTNYTNVTTGDDRVDGGGYRGWYNNVTVAGYTPSDTYACYVYSLDENKNIVRSEDDSEFYFGWYEFSNGDFSDYRAIYDDFAQKLEGLYGTGTPESDDYKTTVTWSDSDNNQIRLLINAKENYVTLGYIAADADARLDEMQAALDAEAAAAEQKERDVNKENVSGL